MEKKLEQMHVRRIEHFQALIGKRVLPDRIDLQVDYAPDEASVPFSECRSLAYQPLSLGDTWAKNWKRAWLHMTGTVPAEWDGTEVVARIDIGGEGLVFSPDGIALQGITNGSVFDLDFARDLVPLTEAMRSNKTPDFYVEASANALFGMFTEQDPEQDSDKRYGKYDASLNHAYISRFDREHWYLWLDLNIVTGMIGTLPENGVRRARLITCASDAIDLYADNPANVKKCRARLADELGKPAAASDLSTIAVGHAHIDTGWLWPVCETVRKCGRTFASQVDLIQRYTGYVFGASQPQHYQFVKEYYPELYERVKECVKRGNWEPQGGMWVEADCNIISGESMVRQILHGKKFFQREFGVDVDNLWLPDVFGYSAALPQILQKSGIRFFLTQKISWNQFNEFPHNTFTWRGIDGSEVLTHFPPENNYSSRLNPQYLVPGRDKFREKDRLETFLSLFGVGDGGGGPKAEFIETGSRMANMEGAPKVHFGTARDFFHDLENYQDKLDRWTGELYLEIHRGTLTTQSRIKRHNRKLEQQLTATEILASLLPVNAYPAEELEQTWKQLLINQFHDILPGSSITEVYRVAEQEFEACHESCRDLMQRIADQAFDDDPDGLALVNTLSQPYSGLVELPESFDPDAGLIDEEGNLIPVQADHGKAFARVDMPGLSILALRKTHQHDVDTHAVSELMLENEVIRYRFDANGTLIEAVDLETGENILPDGAKGNVLSLYNDRPNDWDAWDVDLFYEKNILEIAQCTAWEPLSRGDAFQGLHFEFTIGSSTVTQDVYLAEGTKELRFATTVDWREKHRMLRVAFPVNIHTEREAFDIQYGHVYRPTHRNTSWDWARFECVGQRYADLSDRDRGVALMNDCKYGYRLADGVLDLNLLRAPTYPDPDADQGLQYFNYSLYPHRGDLADADVMARAAMLNREPLLFEGKTTSKQDFPWKLESEGISLEVVKKAEDEDVWILRLVETRGRKSTGKLTIALDKCSIVEADLMENNISGELKNPLPLELTAFEIRTYKIKA